MNRQEAINLIQEIDTECKMIVGRSFMLVKPDVNDQSAAGYQVRVKAKMDKSKTGCLETIAAQYGYSLKAEPERDAVVIFEPKEKKGFRSIKDSDGSGTM